MADDNLNQTAMGMSLANGAILFALLTKLEETGALTRGEIRGVLQTASNGLSHLYGHDLGRIAGRTITDLLAHFPEVNTQESPE